MVEILANVYLLEAIINLVRLFTRGTNIRKFLVAKRIRKIEKILHPKKWKSTPIVQYKNQSNPTFRNE